MNKIFKSIVQERYLDIKQYIASGQDLNIRNSQGDTLLITACKFQRSDIIKELVDARADIYAKNEKGLWSFPALMENCKNYNIARFLLDKIDANHMAAMPYCSRDAKLIKNAIDKGFGINEVDSEGQNLLHKICSDMDIDTLNLALKLGADINSLDNSGNTPLHKYCQYRFMFISEKATPILLENTSDIFKQNKHGFCAFYFALTNKHFDLAEAILNKGKYHLNFETAIGNIEKSVSGLSALITTAPRFQEIKTQLFQLKLDHDLDKKEKTKPLKI